jgi:hypothetical protein
MNERACERCGAENRADASYCWRCYTPFGGATPPTVTAAGRIGAAAYASGSRSVATAPSTLAPATAGGDRAAWVVKGVVFVLAFAGGWWLVNHFLFSGFPFPDEVAGYERVESDEAREAVEAIAAFGQAFDFEMEMAFYGTEARPAYMMFVFEVPEQMPPTAAKPFGASSGSLPFQCQEEVQGTSCYWSDRDGNVLGVGGFGRSLAEVEPVARRVRADLDD